MKACVIQPAYCMDFSRSDGYFQWELDALDRCDPSMDLIVLPEYSNVPCYAGTKAEMRTAVERYTDALLTKASETAARCGATVFVNCIYENRNTTLAFSKSGALAGKYCKQHLVPAEMDVYELDKDYTYEHQLPTVLDVDGVRYGFLVCYDSYFYEGFANLARLNPEVIVACSYQRSDPHHVLEMLHQFCAYHTNAWVVRSSVSMGADSPVGGCSMVVSPDGKVLLNMENQVGMACADFDPHQRYLKAAGFGNPPAPHHHYVEAGRRPWKYRPAGPAMVRPDKVMTYPRVCAHRGFSTVAPENSMPAFGAAVALGAEEIEFDLWGSSDGVIVSIHDPVLDRVSTGSGYVWEHTFEELRQYDFGIKKGPGFEGLKIPTFEDILKKFACQVVMNVHVKSNSDTEPMKVSDLVEIIRLIRAYDCADWCYFMSGNPAILAQMQRLAPDICRCAGATRDPDDSDLVEKALKYGAKKIQLYKPHFRHYSADYIAKAVEKAHAHGIAVNMFWSDDPEETKQFLSLGCDTILSNDYQRVAMAVKP